MTVPWALQMPCAQSRLAAGLRLAGGIRVCEIDGQLWLTGDDLDDAWRSALRALPCTGRYVVSSDNRLVPQGGRVPIGQLPAGPWTPISKWFEPAATAAALPGRLPVGADGDAPGLILQLTAARH